MTERREEVRDEANRAADRALERSERVLADREVVDIDRERRVESLRKVREAFHALDKAVLEKLLDEMKRELEAQGFTVRRTDWRDRTVHLPTKEPHRSRWALDMAAITFSVIPPDEAFRRELSFAPTEHGELLVTTSGRTLLRTELHRAEEVGLRRLLAEFMRSEL